MAVYLHNLPAVAKKKKRRGRGIGSHGAKSGRGMKGQKSRAGYSSRAGFEGGQTPLYQRLPKGRGTKQTFSSQVVKPAMITLKSLNNFKDGDIVGPGALAKKNLINKKARAVKLIGSGKMELKVTVRVHQVTEQAKAAVEGAGGKIEIIKAQVE